MPITIKFIVSECGKLALESDKCSAQIVYDLSHNSECKCVPAGEDCAFGWAYKTYWPGGWDENMQVWDCVPPQDVVQRTFSE